ncbi:hypothetical protein MNBD_GAMMA03-45 [hydrothermal vent metagenome]|uniref:DUF2806 domain-containing protein n=1 Tax=hydrothermal vent metagenome TaxID=652676 RepID=A0A3B0WV06_9ZZZZ
MEIKDLAGLSDPLKKLIGVVSTGIGALSKPYLIRKTADAKAYEIKIIAQAVKDNQRNLKNIEFNDEKLSLISLDDSSLKNELSLEDRTQQRIQFKEQKRQINIESITQKAVENLESESKVSDEPVDEDWTSRFFNYAEDISNEDMQGLWGRILAGEIKKPKSYSLRTLDILRNLSTEEAEIFIKFGSLAICSGGIAFLLNFKNEKLLEEEYQLNFSERLLLEELGLLAANNLQFEILKTENSSRQVVFVVGNVIVVHEKLKEKPEQQLQVLVFTKIGQELLQLVNMNPKEEYLQLLATKLNRENGLVQYANILEKLPNGQVKHAGLIDVPLTEIENEDKNKREQAETKT